MLPRISGFLAAAFLAASAPAQDFVRTYLLAPQTLTKTAQNSFLRIDFTLKPLVNGPYELELNSSNLTDVQVFLNGIEHLNFRDFRSEPSQIRRVALESSNTLQVELKGAVGESVSIAVAG